MRILSAIDHYLGTSSGDIIKLQPLRTEFRRRVGDYRVHFLRLAPLTIKILRVRHRSQAYR